MGNQRFSITPSAAAADKNISDSVYRTLACLGVHGNKNGWCHPELKTLAEMRGVSASRISQDLKILVDAGYVQKRARFENHQQISNMYRILFDNEQDNADDGAPEGGGLTSGVKGGLTPEVKGGLTSGVKQTIEEEEGDSLKSISLLYEQEIGMITPMVAEDLRELSKEFSSDWITRAFREAVKNRVRKLPYIRSILERWKKDGLGHDNRKKSTPDASPAWEC